MLENLNPEQRKAVEKTSGPLLVLAGAGTGKTRVLTTRIAYILANQLAMPWNILALTFTNKAANEMKRRVHALSDGAWCATDLWCGTFHSICLRILRANANYVGLRRDFLIFGEDEQKTVLKTVLTDMGLDIKDYNPADWVERISAIKDKGLNAKFHTGQSSEKILNAYNAELARLNAVDFGDIILKVLELFEKNPDVLQRYQNQFKYILVDEFQDTNAAQMQFLQLLTRGIASPNICCVGDDDQSIYSWRGAEVQHILNFNKTFPDSELIRLETNYRSTKNILNAANSLIRHNMGRLGKELQNQSDSDGVPVYVLTLPSDRDEVRFIADTIIRKPDTDNYNKFAILIRAGGLSRLFEEEFAARGIPYRLVGATKFYDRAEIRDAIAYLRLLVYPFDDLSFLRVIGKPRRGFGGAAIAKLRGTGAPLMDALRTASLSGRQRGTADEFISAFNFDWQSVSPVDAAQTLLEKSGYINMWRQSTDVDAPDRLENIKELITNVIGGYDTLPEFLEHAALMMTDENDSEDATQTNDAVSVMTIHAAKGLEFDTVFLPAWEEGIFPNDKAIGEGALEEERRLAYVAITRARRVVMISNAMSRMLYGTRQYNSPSRFITEMDNRFLEFHGGVQHHTYHHIPTSYEARPRKKMAVSASPVGKLVAHPELGRGVVIEDGGEILTIAFNKRGIKKVAKQFVIFE